MPEPTNSPRPASRAPEGVAPRAASADTTHAASPGAASPDAGVPRRLDGSEAPSNGPVYEPVEPYGSGSWAARENLTDILRRQLLGPIGGDDELLPVAPDGRYLIGRIAPTRLDDTGGQATEPPTSEAADLASDAGLDTDPDAGASTAYLGDDLDARASTGVPVSSVDESSPDGDEDTGGDRDDEPVRRGLMIPASMGLRFQVLDDLEAVTVHASWGVYHPEKTGRTLPSGGEERHFRRTDISIPVRVPLGQGDGATTDYPLQDQVTLRVDTHLDATTHRRLVEIALCNDRETPRRIPVDAWLFQTRLDVTPAGAAEGQAVFLPVHDTTEDPHLPGDPEEARLELQYRDRLEFAVGRTCSADWTAAPGARRATHVCTEWMPTAETPQTRAADVPGALLDMQSLAVATPAELEAGLRPIVAAYTNWLDDQQAHIPALPAYLRETAAEVVDEARQVRDQLADGVDFLLADPEARRCFAFMNRVMADQRVHSQIAAARQTNPSLTPAQAEQQVRAGTFPHHWRVFQLAFVLMQIRALTDPTTPRRSGADRAKVELLFFPTGGGKTEAYLGLAAYAFAIRRRQGRITGPDGAVDGSAGVTVLMRYTLRLLTSQQFQRATTLVCAAELARREDPATWGEEPFRIGLWVGTAVSPKRVEEAAKELTRLRSQHAGAGYRFSALQLGHCPWCGRPLGHNDVEVDEARGRVLVYCPDEFGDCPFSPGGQVDEGIPVLTTDEEIYRLVPAFVIATVDKFARLAREGQAASLFGHVARYCERHGYVPALDDAGNSDYPGCEAKESHPAKGGLPAARIRPATRLRPPDLIIQDELHLITGALGTTVGLFEVAVDALTTWRMYDPDGAPREVKPLIVASSATVRRAVDQVRALYGRFITVFPPQVLDAADTFFSKEITPDREHPGRRYVGLSATGVRLTNAEIQIAQVLMAGGQLLLDEGGEEADPYMTLVGYFSATRELAGMARYMQDDIQTALAKGIRGSGLPRRRGTAYGALNLGELTSRIASTEITSTLDEMAVGFDPAVDSTRARAAYREARAAAAAASRNAPTPRPHNPFDAVLATSMLQVGVDVTRLGLMLIVGQPKNTAEYIQASSRVGRDAGRPGLVVTVGNWARPRDLAHYEQFRHFHDTFYRRVEPLSVTPFSVTSLERGLDGVLVASARVLQAAVTEGSLNPERGAGNAPRQQAVLEQVAHAVVARIENSAAGDAATRYARDRLQGRIEAWVKRAEQTLGDGRHLSYERVKDPAKQAALIMGPEAGAARTVGGDGPVLVVANSMREVQPEINLLVSPDPQRLAWRPPEDAPAWQAQEPGADADRGHSDESAPSAGEEA
ncbi:DISARM system helicase DrmA [Actinomyces succiniciruminis]|uniref:Helicase n=1 Tax=Actinomyces succiniciruminis TaxID=1522002 RepID=A0A1L7RN32_9ACTO|nr:DISARM system helicase DrmA [Actinomyces succiniciruminis]CED90503.1 Helicase [Actinomyces succiniciruminis]